jgi:hypothetical protein
MLSRLSPTVYPEYTRIFDLMIGRTTHPLYECCPEGSIQKIKPNRQVIIKNASNVVKETDYKCLVVCIGLQTNTAMFEDKYDFLADYQALQDPSLYAIGSVVGDHFVRFLIGGSFRVAQKLLYEACCLLDMNANCI